MDMKNTYKKYKEKKKEKILLIYGLLPRGGGGSRLFGFVIYWGSLEVQVHIPWWHNFSMLSPCEVMCLSLNKAYTPEYLHMIITFRDYTEKRWEFRKNKA